MHSHKILISPLNSAIKDRLKELGFETIDTKPIESLIDYERYHADMQLQIIGNRAFISESSLYLKEHLEHANLEVIICKKIVGKYPNNILLNAALIGDKLICKPDSTAQEILEYCNENGISIVKTNQGYSKCSTLVVADNAIITADKSIFKAAKEADIDVLLISSGNIYLDSENYGFIGGASGVVGDTVLFFGDISHHPDSCKIVDFLEKHYKKHISLRRGQLMDLGGLVLIE